MRRMYSKPQLLEAVEQEAKTNGIKVFEDIKDKDGHPRFIEGDIELTDTISSEYELTYGKWSLSGSHLQLVMAFNIPNASTTTAGQLSKKIFLPQWILDKIYPTYAFVVSIYQLVGYYNNGTVQNIGSCYLRKDIDSVSIYIGSTTTTDKLNARISFDLIIDNE